MATNPTMTVDVSGLPEPVVQDILRLVQTLRENMTTRAAAATAAGRPLLGRFADLGLTIPKEQLDEAQREAWTGFPREMPEPPKRP